MIRIGILGAADIAIRRFLPPLMESDEYEFAGVASNSAPDRAKTVTDSFGGRIYGSYEELLSDETIDAVYIPLPPALHYKWGMEALKAGKHVYMEKPFTTCLEDTVSLVEYAKEKNLTVFENYGFTYHNQVELIDSLMKDRLGELRLLRAYFGFPKRSDSDFRYDKSLGGGSLLDAGGYVVKIARHYLGDNLEIMASSYSQMPGHDVDGWGSIMAKGRDGVVCQLAFGMDNQYKCDLELWGSVGSIHAPRIFTPPPQFVPKISVTDMKGTEYFEAEPDDAFRRSQQLFAQCVQDGSARRAEYEEILTQAGIINNCQ